VPFVLRSNSPILWLLPESHPYTHVVVFPVEIVLFNELEKPIYLNVLFSWCAESCTLLFKNGKPEIQGKLTEIIRLTVQQLLTHWFPYINVTLLHKN
jgi:hypothetical protein